MENTVSLNTTVPSGAVKTADRTQIADSSTKPLVLFNSSATNKAQKGEINNTLLSKKVDSKYGKDFCDNVNKNISKIENHPKVKKTNGKV